MNRTKRLGIGLGLSLLLAAAASAQEAPPELISINVAGAGFAGHVLPGKEGTNYFFPKDGYFQKWADKGIKTVRFSFKWERLQPKAMEEFDQAYAAHIDKAINQAGSAGIKVLLDIHNYGRYYGDIVGREVPIDAYRNLMERIALRWGSNPAVYAYDLMNEPYGDAEKYWFDMAQAGIDGIRRYDKRSTLYIEGRRWSSSYHWPKYNDDLLDLKDPSNNIVYSAHMYVDKNASGLYKEKIGTNGFDPDPMVGVQRVKPFVEWLAKHGQRGHIGEFGVPYDDPRWLEIMDNTLAYLQKNCIPLSYWAAGSYWGRDYPMSVEPQDGKDRPQWSVLKKYLGTGGCSTIGPKREVSDSGQPQKPDFGNSKPVGPVNPVNVTPTAPVYTTPVAVLPSPAPTVPSTPNASTDSGAVPGTMPVSSQSASASTVADRPVSRAERSSTGPQWAGKQEWAGKETPAYQTISAQ